MMRKKLKGPLFMNQVSFRGQGATPPPPPPHRHRHRHRTASDHRQQPASSATARCLRGVSALPLDATTTHHRGHSTHPPSPTHQASKPFKDVMREEFPDYLTPVEERRVQKLAHMRRRGKGPPRKGEGKRAGKKK